MSFLNFPKELRELRQWVLWRLEERGGKTTKIPYQPNGTLASSTDEATWSSFEECVSVVSRFSGVGFVFVEGYIGIDLDKCFGEDKTLLPWAREIVEQFPSYTEVSPSGKGLHIIIASDVPLQGRKNGSIECYAEGRYFTVTGNVFEGRSVLHDVDIMDWYSEVFASKAKSEVVEMGIPSATLPSDEKILTVMFRAKNGKKLQSLYKGEQPWQSLGFTSQSSADLSLVSALMFYCGNNTVVADRLFRASALMRPKWDEHRGEKTYGEKTLEAARASDCMQWSTPEQDFLMSGDKDPKALLVLENICRVIQIDDELNTRFRLNDFSHTVEIYDGGEWRNLQDNDVLETARHISVKWRAFSRVKKDMVTDAIRSVAHKYKVNPPRDYFEGLAWDRIPRIDTWLMQAYGVNDEEVYRKIGSNWLKGLVKRVLHPGCQFDEVLVLESPQGYRKSTSLRVLGSPWHTESTLSTEDKDFYMLMASNVIVEFSEGEIVGRTSAKRLKAVITKTHDQYRPPYERNMLMVPRGCVFAMTTNDPDYQKDDTGGRRWLPVVLQKVADIDWLEANRDQLFAEAVYRVEELKETTHEYPTDRLTELQEEKREGDPYDEIIHVWYHALPSSTRDSGVTTLEAYRAAVAHDTEAKLSKADEWRIASIFRRVLGLQSKTLRLGNLVAKRWVKVSK